MVSTIRINDFKTKNALVVPSIVISKDITGDYVYVVDTNNIVSKTYVTPSLSHNENSMIKEGLKPGDNVIIEGYHLVSSGIEVNIKD